MDYEFRLFPEQASTTAQHVDLVYLTLWGVTVLFVSLILVCILYFGYKYRRGSRADRTGQAFYHIPLEVTWTIIPLVITLGMFAWGAKLFVDIHRPPADADQIYVLAKQWMWKLQHPNGKSEINQLHLPVGRAVQLKMISEDVIHSFFVPACRVKMDVLPGRYTSLWLQPTKAGRFHLFCAEYCGTGHSQMIGEVVVLEPADYSKWLAGQTGAGAAEQGRKLFEHYRCQTCHNDAAQARCPSLRGLFGQAVRLTGGGTVNADEQYLRTSILDPNSQIVAGYQPVMPTYHGQLNEEQILQIIAYLQTLEAVPLQPSATGEETPQ